MKMSKQETPGTSSSCYSTSSNSSSAENISSGTSTIENGDLSVFTFLISKSISPDLSHLPEQTNSCVHSPNCHCACKTTINGFRTRESTPSLAIDPYGVNPHNICDRHHRHHHLKEENCRCDCTFGKLCQNSRFGDNYSSLLSQSNLDGYLIRSLEKGVLYPVIHWSSKTHDNFTLQSHSSNRVVFNQGVYKELKRVIPPDAWMHKSDGNGVKTLPKRPTWLVLGYKSLEKTLDSVLEATWKEWTGTRHIYLNLRHDFDIQRISFFNKVHPQDNLDLFMYLVLMEIGNVDDRNVMWLLDFIQRTRVERMKGFLTVYMEVENEVSTITEEYLKYFSNEVASSKSSESLTEVGNHDVVSGKKFIEKLLQEIQDTPLVDYF